MRPWLTSRKNAVPNLCLHFQDGGLAWSTTDDAEATSCGSMALGILEQLESEGLIQATNDGYFADWNAIYAVRSHPQYLDVSDALGIPPIRALAPCLESTGTLSDANFGISIASWIDQDGLPVPAYPIRGALLKVNGSAALMPEASWRVVARIGEFLARPANARNDTFNRMAWGHIRQAALSAGCHLSDFLYRSVVLTPEKLQIDLNRVDIAGSKVVEVIPKFSGCPAGWLDQFDGLQRVPDRFDIPTAEGIVQVIVAPAVKTVLQEIKKMPGRRVAGSRAEAFVSNPFAALGPDASEAIDPEQFERARASANLIFERFTAHVERDAMGNPRVVGLLVETARGDGSRSANTAVEIFGSDDELERFIKTTQRRIEQGLQISAWRDYEFELLGDTYLELETLQAALETRRKGFPLVTFAQIYDLTAYSSRVEEIGAQRPFYSPYIAKKDEGEGWFPENLIPVIAWTPEESGDAVAVPLTPDLEQLIERKLATAKATNENSINLPSFPRPLSISESERILEAVKAFRAAPPAMPPHSRVDATGRTPGTSKGAPGLVIKANIESVNYEEARRELLITYSPIPSLPKHALLPQVSLMDHQKSGVAWLQHLLALSPDACRGAVLADDMGLGKTLQLLTFLAGAFESDPRMPPALIVAPVSLLENWQEEVARFFKPGALPIATVYGDGLQQLRIPRSAIDQQLIEEGLVKFLRPGWVGSARIVLTTYETLRDLEFSFAAEKWSVMICDEAQKIKNPNALVTRAAKKQNVRFKVACTGTPVENTLADLWCLFDFVQPGMLGALNEFGRRYRKPIEAKTEEETMRVEELRAKISAQILRRTKKDVAKDLPKKIVVESCRALPISAFQLSAYSQAVDLFRRRNEPGVRTPFKNHLGLLHYLRVICTDPRAIGAEASTLESLESYRKRAPKLDWLLKQLLLIRERQEKAIVFCEFRGVQRLLRHYIHTECGISPDVINGDSEASASHQNSRQKRIRAFQEKEGFNVIVLSPIAVGFGVNIQGANHVIHYTRTWNPAKEDQATDRAYRIGQTKDVFVYYPVVKSQDFVTFDVKLNQLLDYKRELAEDMLNGSGDITPRDFDIDKVVPVGIASTLDPIVTLDDVLKMSPRYVEGLAAALWQAQGYSLVYKTPDSGDGGVDVVAIAGSRGVLIQCKSSTNASRQVTWEAVKDVVAGQKAYQRLHPNIEFELACFTNQRFNTNAREQAELHCVSMFDRDSIAQLLENHQVTFSAIESFLFSTWADAAAEG